MGGPSLATLGRLAEENWPKFKFPTGRMRNFKRNLCETTTDSLPPPSLLTVYSRSEGGSPFFLHVYRSLVKVERQTGIGEYDIYRFRKLIFRTSKREFLFFLFFSRNRKKTCENPFALLQPIIYDRSFYLTRVFFIPFHSRKRKSGKRKKRRRRRNIYIFNISLPFF